MKDSPAIILASGLAGLLGAFFPTAQGWVLEQSFNVLGTELSAQSLGLMVVSKLFFLPALATAILGAIAMKERFAKPPVGVLSALCSVATLGSWYFQKATIDQLSIVGVGPAIGLFLLLVSGLGGLGGGLLLAAWPPKPEKG